LFVCSYIFNLEFEIIENMEEILDCLYYEIIWILGVSMYQFHENLF